HDLRDAGRGPGDVRLVGAEPAAALRGRGNRRLGRGAAVPLRPDLRRLVGAGAAHGRLGDRAAVRDAVHRAPARHGLAVWFGLVRSAGWSRRWWRRPGATRRPL